MSILTLKPRTEPYGPGDNGTILTPAEFDRAEFEEGWRYELINGVLARNKPGLKTGSKSYRAHRPKWSERFNS